MKIAKVDQQLTPTLISKAQKKFDQIMLELGVRHNNHHVGSGLGGNNYQLYSFLGMSHSLIKTKDPIKVTYYDGIYWNPEWLAAASKVDIRKQVDTIFPLVEVRHPDACAFAKMHNTVPPQTPPQDQLVYAMTICHDLALKLDAGDMSTIQETANKLSPLPHEIILSAVRTQIQIDRIIKYNLDEHKSFGPLLQQINKLVDS